MFLDKRNAQSFLDSIQSWYATSTQVSEICGQCLEDVGIVESDIGIMLDKVDRKLFALRNYASDARSILRRKNPQLAQRIKDASRMVYVLRNDTARFLIRAQGPGLVSGKAQSKLSEENYQRAFDEVGWKACQVKKDLDEELALIWEGLAGQVEAAQTLLEHS